MYQVLQMRKDTMTNLCYCLLSLHKNLHLLLTKFIAIHQLLPEHNNEHTVMLRIWVAQTSEYRSLVKEHPTLTFGPISSIGS